MTISAHKSRTDVIHTFLRCAKKDDVIIGYSHAATTILFSNELAKCQASIFLVNPFKSKSNFITALRDNLKEDFDSAVKKFILMCKR